ncbi:MAG: fructosamine kinase family protein [Ekhidna sp.]|nr:fructosamine kinase family protein [Ekhidna sp.]
MNNKFFNAVLYDHIGVKSSDKFQRVAGGCINETAKIQAGSDCYFLKWSASEELDLFEKEALGLSLLVQNSEIKIPNVLGIGTKDNKSYLLLEWIDPGVRSNQFWPSFGRKLAIMHRFDAEKFGLDHNNYIGQLPQSNIQHKSWTEFFVNERLEPQLKLAREARLVDKHITDDFRKLYNCLEILVPKESPSFIHGDLWSGNFLCNTEGEPVLIDPAVHYGHRETELAFTTMFGGFEQPFYEAYIDEYPQEKGFEERIDIHNLYPLLVHLNLFGSSYLSDIKRILKKFTF